MQTLTFDGLTQLLVEKKSGIFAIKNQVAFDHDLTGNIASKIGYERIASPIDDERTSKKLMAKMYKSDSQKILFYAHHLMTCEKVGTKIIKMALEGDTKESIVLLQGLSENQEELLKKDGVEIFQLF